MPAGIIAGSSTIGHAIMDKPIHMLRAVPFPALSPLLIVLLGIGEAMKVALIAIGVFALIYVNVRDGVRGIDRNCSNWRRHTTCPNAPCSRRSCCGARSRAS